MYEARKKIYEFIQENNYEEAIKEVNNIFPQVDQISDNYLNKMKELEFQVTGQKKQILDNFRFFNQAVANNVYIMAGDIAYKEKDYKEALRLYEKNEEIAYYSRGGSTIILDKYNYAYIFVDALKSVDFDV